MISSISSFILMHIHYRLSGQLTCSPQESLMGFRFPSVAAALCIVYKTIVTISEIISFMKYWEYLGGKGNWVILRHWCCYYFLFLKANGRGKWSKTVVLNLFYFQAIINKYIIYTLRNNPETKVSCNSIYPS